MIYSDKNKGLTTIMNNLDDLRTVTKARQKMVNTMWFYLWSSRTSKTSLYFGVNYSFYTQWGGVTSQSMRMGFQFLIRCFLVRFVEKTSICTLFFLEKPLEWAIFIRHYRGCTDSTEITQIVINGTGTHVFWFFKLLFYYSCPNFSLLLSLFHPPPHTHSHSQSPPSCPCLWVIYTCSLTRPFLFFPPLFPFPLSSGPCQFVPCFYASSSILLICLFCWLGSTYRWDNMMFVFHCLAYFT